jgi:predicted alpha/beta-fold hydrolase
MKRLSRLARIVIATATVAYFMALGLLVVFQEAILFPARMLNSEAGRWARYETRLAVEADGIVLQGWIIPAEHARPAPPPSIIYYGGNAEELGRSVERLRQIGPGYQYVLINYRGYGGSAGVPTEQALKHDAIAILHSLEADGVIDRHTTHLIGRSLGSGVAMHVAAEIDVASLTLITPYDSIENVARSRYPIFPVRLLLRHPFHSVDLVNAVSEPTLVIVAAQDDVVPQDSTARLIDAFGAGRAADNAANNVQVEWPPDTTHYRIFTDETYKAIDEHLRRNSIIRSGGTAG